MAKKLVITHVNADFDAIASAWAASRLYNCDSVWVCTELGATIPAKIMSVLNVKRVNESEIEELDSLDLLVITDCNNSARLGALAELTSKSKRIILFDHHLPSIKNIKASEESISTDGSNTAQLVARLLAENVTITPQEATLYLLGIYEDTGLMTFPNTTKNDALAVASLIECGGDVFATSDCIKQELTREQLIVLNELLMNMEAVNIDGVNISYSLINTDVFIDDISILAQQMMRMENLDTLFLLIGHGKRISLIARSTNSRVNAGVIAAKFGGGGHAAAASANIKGMLEYEALEKLKIAIREEIKPIFIVSEIMSSPALALKADMSIFDAMEYMKWHNLNCAPVLEGSNVVGIVDRRDLSQALKHKLNDKKISFIMMTDIETLSSNTPFKAAENALINGSQRSLPVIDGGILVGVVTRSDLLRLMRDEELERSSFEMGAKARMGLAKTRSIKDIIIRELPDRYVGYLMEIGELASSMNYNVYLVGGVVRDILLGYKNLDMDIVVEGDARIFAAEYVRIKNGKLTTYLQYKTATVTLGNGDKIDFASARTEFYPAPASVPIVELTSLQQDLKRRDFTINAMAVRIDGNYFGQLVDMFGGQRDLLDRKVRILHSLSFIDDPTRMLRAIRFVSRYNFELGASTEMFLKLAASSDEKIIAKTKSGKLFSELKRILMEDNYMTGIKMLIKYNILTPFVQGLAVNDAKLAQFAYLDTLYKRYGGDDIWQLRYALLLSNFTAEEFRAISVAMHAERVLVTKLSQLHSRGKYVARKLKPNRVLKPSERYNIAKQFTHDELLMVCVYLGDEQGDKLISFMKTCISIKPELTGNALKALGVPADKIMGTLLQELLNARIDGQINSRDEEVAYVRNRIRQNN